ncbi:hypothetical protein ACKKBF_B40200 [Auxenochlorella protothecoides x Auxenochlorella symbiontica]
MLGVSIYDSLSTILPLLSLPSYNGNLYLLGSERSEAYCRLRGYGGKWAEFTATMSIGDPFTGFTIGTINPATQGLCTPTPDGPCDYVKLVICYPEGMDYCFETLLHHNLGTADDGFYNTGNKNIGDYNYGNGNTGNFNIGNNNTGSHIVCNNWAADSPCQSCSPAISIISLPIIEFGDAIYLVAADSRTAYCELMGYGRNSLMTISAMNGSYPFPAFSISTINPRTYEICNPHKLPHCFFVAIAECVPEGMWSCYKDANGNAGNYNLGHDNIGNHNRGDNNLGDDNNGFNNIGDHNTGSGIICHGKYMGQPCQLEDLQSRTPLSLTAPPPPNPPPPSPSPPPPPPPPGQECDPSIKFFALPTIRFEGSLYLASSDNPDGFCKRKGFAGAGTSIEYEVRPNDPFKQFLIDTIDAATLATCHPTPSKICKTMSIVECLPAGMQRCLPNSKGNIGNGNWGKNNIGHNNHGNDNNGNDNHGNFAIGSENWGDYVSCPGTQPITFYPSSIPCFYPNPCDTSFPSHTDARSPLPCICAVSCDQVPSTSVQSPTGFPSSSRTASSSKPTAPTIATVTRTALPISNDEEELTSPFHEEEPLPSSSKEDLTSSSSEEEPLPSSSKEGPRLSSSKEEPRLFSSKEEPRLSSSKEEPRLSSSKEEPRLSSSKEEILTSSKEGHPPSFPEEKITILSGLKHFPLTSFDE